MHCVKNVQIRSFFWSVFSRIWSEYWDLWSKSFQKLRLISGWTFKRQPHKMAKHTHVIRQPLQKICLCVFDYYVRFALNFVSVTSRIRQCRNKVFKLIGNLFLIFKSSCDDLETDSLAYICIWNTKNLSRDNNQGE